MKHEPQRENTYRLTGGSNEDSNQPAHPRRLVRVFVVLMKTVYILGYQKCAQWRFWSDCANAQSDLNSSLGAHVQTYVFWHWGSCSVPRSPDHTRYKRPTWSLHYENMPIQILKISPPKTEIFQIKTDIFHISARNIDCVYSLEPPRRGGSNEYPQSMFLSKNRKIMYTPVNSSFTV